MEVGLSFRISSLFSGVFILIFYTLLTGSMIMIHFDFT